MNERLEARIFGRVQMVMYRDFAMRKARSLQLVGVVKNENDGSVTVVAEGAHDTLLRFIEKLTQGSVLADVERVDVLFTEKKAEFTNFTIRYS
jgi:acylphosphatase